MSTITKETKDSIISHWFGNKDVTHCPTAKDADGKQGWWAKNEWICRSDHHEPTCPSKDSQEPCHQNDERLIMLGRSDNSKCWYAASSQSWDDVPVINDRFQRTVEGMDDESRRDSVRKLAGLIGYKVSNACTGLGNVPRDCKHSYKGTHSVYFPGYKTLCPKENKERWTAQQSDDDWEAMGKALALIEAKPVSTDSGHSIA